MRSEDIRAGAEGETALALSSARLEAWWPVARDRLVAALRLRGIDPATAEEAVAEAATRALSRRLAVRDIDDFCRWAFVVARNVAVDKNRRASRFELTDSIPDLPDACDVAGEVEARQRWNDTAAALLQLSSNDRTALLGTLTAERPPANRRDAVKEAVRRHRARARLHNVLGRAGGFLGALRRVWSRPMTWSPSSSEGIGALLLPLLMSTWGSPVATAAPVGLDAAPSSAAAPGTASEAVPEAGAAGALPVRVVGGPRPRQAARAPAPSLNHTGVSGPGWWTSDITPSPSYEEDHTVFADSHPLSCTSPQLCSLLMKSTDGGATWTPLRATGRDSGRIMLPPAYPRDPRIFSVSWTSLSVSTDGGETFLPVANVNGPATMSTLFSAGDPRIVFGAERFRGGVLATQYIDGEPGVRPLYVPLPGNAVPLGFSFSPDFARDRRTLLWALDAPGVDIGPGGALRPALNTSSVYTCEADSCTRVVDLGVDNAQPEILWTADRHTVLVGASRTIHRSTDGGRTFPALQVPGVDSRRMLRKLVAGSDGRLFASVGGDGDGTKLFVSDDDGTSWSLVRQDTKALMNLVALPDGALLDARPPTAGGGIHCSLDGGSTWMDHCDRR